MRKLKVVRILFVVACLSIGASPFALCNFGAGLVGPVNSCTPYSCGYGCTVTSTSVWSWLCYTSMDQCCQFAYQTKVCKCLVGIGYGLDATRYVFNNALCSVDGATCVLLGAP
jgi:hypothetical protein